jgi:chromosomal replication initiator protein
VDNIEKPKEQLWGLALERLTNKLPSHALNTWFAPIVPISIDKGRFTLSVPSQFFSEWIDSHYGEQLLSAIRLALKSDSATFKLLVKKEKERFEGSQMTPRTRKPPKKNRVNKNYLFKNFIEGSNNEFAKNAAQAVAKSPGEPRFNPLIIYGGVGLGKTHLLHAIGNKALKKEPNSNVVLVTSEQFTLDFVNSLRKNKTIEFTNTYRKANVLLIDDIQFFRGKEQTQEQFFHTFNELYQSGRQIVMTSDRFPSEMKGLQDRLISRFQSGLSVDVQPPDFEIRVAILLEKSEQNGLNLQYEAIEFIARHVKNNIRDLEGAIIRILAKSSLMNKEIDFNLVRDVVRERVGSSHVSELTIEDVVKKVSSLTQIKERDIIGKSRKMEIAEARQLSMYLCRNIIGTSLSNIGFYFGGRDHSTVIHAVKSIDKKQEKDSRLRSQVSSITQEFEFLT